MRYLIVLLLSIFISFNILSFAQAEDDISGAWKITTVGLNGINSIGEDMPNFSETHGMFVKKTNPVIRINGEIVYRLCIGEKCNAESRVGNIYLKNDNATAGAKITKPNYLSTIDNNGFAHCNLTFFDNYNKVKGTCVARIKESKGNYTNYTVYVCGDFQGL